MDVGGSVSLPRKKKVIVEVPAEVDYLIDVVARDLGFNTRKEFINYLFDEAIKQWAIQKGYIEEEGEE
jgi:hypothetical protein